MLVGRSVYTHRTMFGDIFLLTERASLSVDGVELRWVFPNDAAHCLPRKVRTGADVVGAWKQVLSRSLEVRAQVKTAPVVELSGGMDSAQVGGSLSQLHTEVASYGLLVGGAAQKQQVQRRESLVRRYGLNDTILPAMAFLPFSKDGARGQFQPYSPYDEPYSEALSAIVSLIGADEGRVVYTGIGGDELVALRSSELPPDIASIVAAPVAALIGSADRATRLVSEAGFDDAAPASVLWEPTLMAAACRAPVFLRNGFWPVNPLGDPTTLAFCESLPVQWRHDKRLFRQRLARDGLDAAVQRAVIRENFRQVMDAALSKNIVPLLEGFLDEGLVLTDLDLVDAGVLRSEIRARRERGKWPDWIYDIANTEASLRSLLA
jgi:asparagine synthase (glutamine-hydrolysing)